MEDKIDKIIAVVDEGYLGKMRDMLLSMNLGLWGDELDMAAKRLCWDRGIHDTVEDIILSCVSRPYERPALKDMLDTIKERAREGNAKVRPSVDENYWCETCGSHSHLEHPINGMCFICGSDNWEPENIRDVL